MDRYDVAIIGGGGTGAAAAYDLTLRGLKVVLFERGELTSGTTGRHHGQLHSGARYALGDVNIARECMAETLILRRMAPDSIEYNQGLFLALNDDDCALADSFVEACLSAGIPAREIPVGQALSMESRINPKAKRAVLVPDGTIDAYRLAMGFFASAKARGARIHHFSEVTGIDIVAGSVGSLLIHDLLNGREYRVRADAVINAAGPWSNRVAALAGIDVPVTAAVGTMVAVEGRLTNMVVSRLRRPGDGDIVVPQRRLSIIGSTQRKTDNPDGLKPEREEVAFLLAAADELVPGFSLQAFRAAWSAARPLAGRAADDGRAISRDIAVFDHGSVDGVKGLFSIIGGKATTLRIMGKKVADAVAGYLGVSVPCCSEDQVLLPHGAYWRLP
jgi:glycerol-3-phosphate dehydrogenase